MSKTHQGYPRHAHIGQRSSSYKGQECTKHVVYLFGNIVYQSLHWNHTRIKNVQNMLCIYLEILIIKVCIETYEKLIFYAFKTMGELFSQILYLTNKIPFWMCLVGHVIKSHKARRFDHVTTRFISPYTSKNGILFVIFPFETNLNFSRRQIWLSILGCLGDLDNASLSIESTKKSSPYF